MGDLSQSAGDDAIGGLVGTSHRYLLVLRFMLVNLVAISLLVAAYFQGWLDGFFISYTMELSAAIFLFFVYGLVLCGARTWRVTVELNDVKTGTPKPASWAGKHLSNVRDNDPARHLVHAGALRLKLSNRIANVRHIANSLVFLGLIGTVIGFIIALSGVDPAAITDVENVAPMVSIMVGGMALALYTTLVGAVLYVWLIIDYRILATGTVHLITATIELGDAGGRH